MFDDDHQTELEVLLASCDERVEVLVARAGTDLRSGNSSAVYLGRLGRADQGATVDIRGRRQVGVLAAMVEAPEGRALMHVGAKSADDQPCFTVEVPGLGGGLRERLRVSATSTSVTGDLLVRGGVQIGRPEEKEATPGRALVFGKPVAEPKAAAPWSMSVAEVVRAGRSVRQLRVEMGTAGNGVEPNQITLVIGRETNKTFVPCLTVAADGTTTVHGDLRVGGTVTEGPIAPDPSDPRFRQAMTASWAKELHAASGGLNAVDDARFTVKIADLPPQSVVPSTEFSYKISLNWAADKDKYVADVLVYETVALGDTLVRAGVVTRGLEVKSHEEVTLARSYRIPAGTATPAILEIRTTVMGLTPDAPPRPLLAKDSKAISVARDSH